MSLCKPLALAALAWAVIAPAQAAMPAKPTLKVSTLDGKTFDLAAERGKWVIVNYWATWCAPCIKEMPDISAFVAAHRNVAAIGLAYDDSDTADIAAFVAKHPVSYPIAHVPMDQPPKDFGQPIGMPTTYLIAPDGSVAKRIVGPVTQGSLAEAMKIAK
jgi:thiol-disulfide isomerase/thioredoxin